MPLIFSASSSYPSEFILIILFFKNENRTCILSSEMLYFLSSFMTCVESTI
ncbi:MAG: hypothetical protein ACOC3Z_00900 [Nanoarchaeota archaeon]